MPRDPLRGGRAGRLRAQHARDAGLRDRQRARIVAFVEDHDPRNIVALGARRNIPFDQLDSLTKGAAQRIRAQADDLAIRGRLAVRAMQREVQHGAQHDAHNQRQHCNGQQEQIARQHARAPLHRARRTAATLISLIEFTGSPPSLDRHTTLRAPAMIATAIALRKSPATTPVRAGKSPSSD